MGEARLSGFEVRVATDADAPGIRRLFSRVFQREMPAEEWEWKFARNPDGWFGTVAVAGGEIIGNYAGWAMRILLDGRERVALSVGDVATDPSVRSLGGRRGVYRSMTERFYEIVESRGVPFCFGFPNARAHEISNRLAGTRALFAVRERHVACDAFGPPPPDAACGDFVGETFDRLWEPASRFLAHAAVRNRARANWRFHARPTKYYRMVWREGPGGMRDWAVLSVQGEQALVADFLTADAGGGDLAGLFAAASAEARRLGARRLVFWETPGGPGSAAIAHLPGESRDAGFFFVVRSFDHEATDRFSRESHFTPALYDMV
jgi:GNAT acetyltransferase-like protein